MGALVALTCRGTGRTLSRGKYSPPGLTARRPPNCQTRGVSCLPLKKERAPPFPAKAIHQTSRPPLCVFCRYMPAALRYVFHCFFLYFPPTPNTMEPNHADTEDLLSPSYSSETTKIIQPSRFGCSPSVRTKSCITNGVLVPSCA